MTTTSGLDPYAHTAGIFIPPVKDDEPTLGGGSPLGHHVQLGISESNLFLLLAQLGRSRELSDQVLLPVGTVYDPFLGRGLDSLVQGLLSGSRFVVVGTPSGITLAPEGGAHQSSITPSIGLELPCLTMAEPAYAAALDWLLCDALQRIADPSPQPSDGGAFYFRLTSRKIDQAPFEAARQRLGTAELRRQVLEGGYRLISADPRPGQPTLYLVGCGAVVPEVLEAANLLAEQGITASVVDVTSLDRLYRGWQRWLRRRVDGTAAGGSLGLLGELFTTPAPLVTVHDGSSHAMAWLGSALGVRCYSLGVDQFGQSGSIGELYGVHGLLPDSIVRAALTALEGHGPGA